MDDGSMPRVTALHADEPTAPRRSPRARRTRILVSGVVLLALGSALLVVAGLAPSPRALVARAFPTPTPTVWMERGGDEFAWLPVATTVKIDGKAPHTTAFAYSQQSQTVTYAVVRVSRGVHTVRYQVGPFDPVTCVVHVPNVGKDTCPELPARGSPQLPDADSGVGRVLNLIPTLDKLPAPQDRTLSASLSQLLLTSVSGSVELAAGDHYMGSSGSAATTQHPLTATLKPAASATFDVATICAGTQQCLSSATADPRNPLTWPLSVPLPLEWDFGSGDRYLVPGDVTRAVINISWDGAWSVDFPSGGVNDDSLMYDAVSQPVTELLAHEGIVVTGGGGDGVNWWVDRNDPMSGSAITFPIVSGSSVSSYVSLLYRAGVLLTVDASGHQALPALPQANAHEQGIYQQIAASAPYPFPDPPTGPAAGSPGA